MKAAIFQQACLPLRIEDVDMRDPGPGEELVRTSASGVCHSDLHFADGAWAPPIACVLGHEASCVVMPKLVDLFLQGWLDPTALVGEERKREPVSEAFDLMKSGKVARGVLQL